MRCRLIFSLILLILALPISAQAATDGWQDKEYIVYRSRDNVELLDEVGFVDFAVVGASELAALLVADESLLYEENREVRLLGDYSDTYYALKWDLNLIGAEIAWDAGYMGNGVKIAVIDTGVQTSHPDLRENLLPGACYVDTTGDITDTNGHGTFVAGMIAAGLNGIGSVGAAPQAKIVPLKCFNEKTGKLSDLIAALRDAVDAFDCKIINLSLGLPEGSELLRQAVNYAIDAGCIVVAAVGNDGTNTLYYPAAYDGVIGVGSVNSAKVVSSFSQQNKSVMLVAPGENVVSTYCNGGYASWSGTSFAAPLVSAAAAVLLGIDNTLESFAMAELLTKYAEDLGDIGYDTAYGYGLLNLGRAIRALRKTPGDADRDGLFTVHDVLILLNSLLNGDGAVESVIADVDENGDFSLRDIILLCKMVSTQVCS